MMINRIIINNWYFYIQILGNHKNEFIVPRDKTASTVLIFPVNKDRNMPFSEILVNI